MTAPNVPLFLVERDQIFLALYGSVKIRDGDAVQEAPEQQEISNLIPSTLSSIGLFSKEQTGDDSRFRPPKGTF